MPEGLELVDFEWDSGNLRHILSDSPHGLTPALCHQIRDGMPRIFEARKGPGRSASHMIIGPDDDQRFWTIIVVYKEHGMWRPITGWPSTGSELKLYQQGANQ